jgi:hypothetical protein
MSFHLSFSYCLFISSIPLSLYLSYHLQHQQHIHQGHSGQGFFQPLEPSGDPRGTGHEAGHAVRYVTYLYIIGVVSVVSQYNCVYYCDTCYILLDPRGTDEAGHALR